MNHLERKELSTSSNKIDEGNVSTSTKNSDSSNSIFEHLLRCDSDEETEDEGLSDKDDEQESNNPRTTSMIPSGNDNSNGMSGITEGNGNALSKYCSHSSPVLNKQIQKDSAIVPNSSTRIGNSLEIENTQPEASRIIESNTPNSSQSQSSSMPLHPNLENLSQPTLLQISQNSNKDEIILVIIGRNTCIGAAYYNITTSELHVMNDIMDDKFNFAILRTLYHQCQPRLVLMETSTADQVINVVKSMINSVDDQPGDESDDSTSNVTLSSQHVQVHLELLPKRYYNFESCYHRLTCLKLEFEPTNMSNKERLAFLNSIFNFKAPLMVHATGLLLKYLDKNWSSIILERDSAFRIASVSYVSLTDMVMVDEETYRSLGIIKRDQATSITDTTKVSVIQYISLFSLLNRCHSSVGVSTLWQILRHPTNDIEKLEERLEVVEFLVNDNHITRNLGNCLKNIDRLPTAMLNDYAAVQAKVSEWLSLHRILSTIITVSEIISSYSKQFKMFKKITESVTTKIHHAKYFIDHVVDFEASKSRKKFTVRSGIDSKLDKLRAIEADLPNLLSKAAIIEERTLPQFIRNFHMVYFPDIGFVLAISNWMGESPSEDLTSHLEFKFESEGTRFYKSTVAKEMDRKLGDIAREITRRQGHIMLQVISFITNEIHTITKAINYCGELDVLISFATVAAELNYVKPKIVDSQIISIQEGRHPLHEIMNNSFIANDTHSGGEYSKMKILTGPNACGKSVYLRQVALIVFMVHIGSFVPAKSATIGTVSYILTQMHSSEAIGLDLSFFLMDLRQINLCLHPETPRALVIIDEFGNGTAEIDGLALLASVLNEFLERGDSCPHVLAATHIHRVFEFLPKDSRVEALTFEYYGDSNTTAFLYKLIPGNVDISFAHNVALNSGLNPKIVNHALKVFQHKKVGSIPEKSVEDKKRSEAMLKVFEYLTITDPEEYDLEKIKKLTIRAVASDK